MAQVSDTTMFNSSTEAKYKKKLLIINYKLLIGLLLCAICLLPNKVNAQVNSVEFGRNRVQYKKFKWWYYQTKNFNVYYNEGGKELAQYVAQAAEKELPQIEIATEFSLQRRANIILYNQFSDMQQSNIGLGIDWQNTTGITKLVNNKMVVYFDANHANLKKQIRGGIAKIIVDNKLFGDDLTEIASNQALLDLPQWLTEGYTSYIAENWSAEKDDELKSEILSTNYKNFYQFSFEKPAIAGHAFWYYIDELYKKENTTYLLYLATQYKSMNKACMQVCKKKFKEVLADFMEYQDEKYYKDISKRKPYPKGNVIESFDINKRLNYYRFNVNPNKRNNSYVVTQFKKGIVRVVYTDDDGPKTLLKFGTKSYENEINPNYPMMAWDNKGTRIAVAYVKEGRLQFFVYDIVTRVKPVKIDLTETFDQIQDMKYSPDSRKMLISAVKNGHTDIFELNLTTEKATQITNDVWDDLDATYVAFPNKTGIIFSSNRPTGALVKSDSTSLPSNNRFNIFLLTNFGDKPELNQINQLSKLKYGNARYPMQYNVNHFTFVSDENGIGNRYAGFFTTKAAGLDTLVLIGDDILRNPTAKDVDSLLRAYKKTDVDSIAVVAVTNDSTYTFPLTNYQSTLGETRIAGDNNQVSEVTRQSDEKVLYKLKINEDVLRRRNITAQPTEYMKKIINEYKAKEDANKIDVEENIIKDTVKKDDFFQTEFANEKKDSNAAVTGTYNEIKIEENNILKTIKHYRYKPGKWAADAASATINTNVLLNRYQPYGGGGGPIQLSSPTPLNGLIRLGTTEMLEDYRVTGAFKISSDLKSNEWMINFQKYKRRIDWGLLYYRNAGVTYVYVDAFQNYLGDAIKQYTNLYQGNISYPFDVNKRIQLTTAIRSDRQVLLSDAVGTARESDYKTVFSTNKIEYIYDNSQNAQLNIWHGLRYKIYLDWNAQINKRLTTDGPNTFNLGFDARYYYPIFRNFIWAGRAAGDFSWGNQKILYYLGGVDGWLMLGVNNTSDPNKFFYSNNKPAQDVTYAFQSLAVNLRGFKQNIANGNNALVLNSEFRLPVFSTLFNRPINNKFLRDFQLVQFVDLGTAWNGEYNKLKRPTITITDPNSPLDVVKKAGGVGPFAGGYGFGVRSSLLGYFVKFDAAWQMNALFRGKPQYYIALGLDF